ncbi:Fur family transcriptional regulator [Propionibacteriaceae bacterium Y2011]|uniref:Fur family transcriptional regulator n=1 Tax=Microlunatus sp. Y2014 TaxID=3418488 RepID=UPI003B45501F
MTGQTGPQQAGRSGGRSTRQRRAVVAELDATDQFRSAQDIHEALRRNGDPVGLATVYRALQTLVDAGEVDIVKTDDGEAVYRQCNPTHHHHLVCRNCGNTVEVTGPTVERWTERVAAEHGFHDVSHTLELFGLCPDCAVREEPGAAT